MPVPDIRAVYAGLIAAAVAGAVAYRTRNLLLSVALGIVLGGMTGVVLAFVIEAVKRPAPGDLAREDFKRTWEDLVGSIPFVGKRSR